MFSTPYLESGSVSFHFDGLFYRSSVQSDISGDTHFIILNSNNVLQCLGLPMFSIIRLNAFETLVSFMRDIQQ